MILRCLGLGGQVDGIKLAFADHAFCHAVPAGGQRNVCVDWAAGACEQESAISKGRFPALRNVHNATVASSFVSTQATPETYATQAIA